MMQYVLQAPNVWHGFLTLSNAAAGAANFPVAYSEAGFMAAAALGERERSAEGKGPKDEGDAAAALVAREVVEGQFLNEATIREMSTMAFA